MKKKYVLSPEAQEAMDKELISSVDDIKIPNLNYTPLGQSVVVLKPEIREKTSSGIFFTDAAKKEQAMNLEGTPLMVVAVNPKYPEFIEGEAVKVKDFLYVDITSDAPGRTSLRDTDTGEVIQCLILKRANFHGCAVDIVKAYNDIVREKYQVEAFDAAVKPLPAGVPRQASVISMDTNIADAKVAKKQAKGK